MCEFCHEHGEGHKWYLNAKNYSDALLAEKHDPVNYYLSNSHGEFVKGHRIIDFIASLPFIGKVILNSGFFKKELQKNIFGQVVPLEEVKKIFSLVRTVCLIPCICRQMSFNKREEMYCFGVSLGNFEDRYLSRYPDVGRKLEKISREKALQMMEKFELDGNFHSVWTISTPFIGTVCNCNARDCLSVRQRISYGIRSFFKAEFVSEIDLEKCTGCRECFKQCNFGAIHFSSSRKKCSIHPMICFGCGICRKFCDKKAISLKDRSLFPGLKMNW